MAPIKIILSCYFVHP